MASLVEEPGADGELLAVAYLARDGEPLLTTEESLLEESSSLPVVPDAGLPVLSE